MTVAAFGVRVRCSVSAHLLEQFRSSLPPHARIVAAPMTGAAWQVRTPDEVEPVLQAVELQVAQFAPGLIFVHAGAVAVAGRVLLLPGRSGVGKSTLVAALTRQGASYLSDEYAPVAADGSVLPYPRPISLRATDGSSAQRWPAASLPSVATAALPLAMVAHLRYDGAAPTSWHPIGPAEAMLALIANTVAAQARTEQMLAHHARALDGALAVSGVRGSAQDAAKRLLQQLADC